MNLHDMLRFDTVAAGVETPAKVEGKPIKVNDQVMYKKTLRNGTLIRIGSVVSINAATGKAKIFCPAELSNLEIPLDQLTLTSERFNGVTRRTLSPYARQVKR